MSLTEEQRGTAAFDLEKARAVDIDLLAATDWGELRARYRAALAEIERLKSLIDKTAKNFLKLEPGVQWEGGIDEAMLALVNEIERLRKIIDSPLEEESWKADHGLLLCAARKWHAAYRKAQNSNLLRKQENERLRAREAGLEERLEWTIKNFVKERDGEVQEQAAKIRELEADVLQKSMIAGKLAEEVAEGKIGPDATKTVYQTPISAENPQKMDVNHQKTAFWQKTYPTHAKRDEILNAPTNGKIGPDAKPHCWQITEERIAAITEILDICEKKAGWLDQEIDMLRAMLEEAE